MIIWRDRASGEVKCRMTELRRILCDFSHDFPDKTDRGTHREEDTKSFLHHVLVVDVNKISLF